MQLKSGIYKITCLKSKDFYIGSSKDLNHRWNTHLYTLKNNKHCNIILQRKYNKYGKENFIFDVISKCPEEYLIKLEQWFIDNLKPKLNLYKIAYSPIGFKHSEETKIKLSNLKKGKSRPKHIMDKLAEFNKGKEFSEGHILKLKIAYSKREIKGNPSKLNALLVKEIRYLLKDNHTLSYIANKYNISSAMVSKIKNNLAWANVTI